MDVSPITLGTSGLGAGTTPGSIEEAAAVDVAVDLLDSSHTYIDTSNNYSLGRSEAILGVAISRRCDGAERIISKVDCDPETRVLDRDRVLRSFEETIVRLGVDRLRLLHLHDPYSVSFDEAVGAGGAVEGLTELRESGLVDAIGIAAGPAPLMARYVATEAFDAVLIHNRFTIVDQSAAPVFAEAKARGMTVFNAAPFGAGILVTGAKPGAIYAYRPAPAALILWVEKVEKICDAYAVTLPAVALHYSLRSPLVDSTIVGVSSPGRRVQLDALAATDIPEGLWADLAALGAAPSPIDDSRYE